MDFKLRTNAKFFNNAEILLDLQRVAKKLKSKGITGRDYLKYGTFSQKVFRNRFGSWNNALKKANLSIMAERFVDEKVLFENLEKIWRSLGRQPFYNEMKRPLSEYTPKPYVARWGGWMKACEAFIKYKKGDLKFEKLLKQKSTMTSRSISEKKRLQVLKRDNFSCVICGRSPATHLGVILHVDHIRPFSKGGGNEPENLRTLCSKCNLGRNNDDRI